MASGTPVGNMVIKVDLDSTGVEKSMTGLQRQLKSSNKAMGAQLSAFGRSEKSASKYGVLIEGLSNRHRIQARMVEEARAKYKLMSSTYGENSVKAQQAAQQLNEQIARYQETGRELNAVKSEFQEFQRVQTIQSKGWYKVADGMDQFGGKLKTAGHAMDRTGQTLTRKVTLPLGVVGGLAIKTGSDFESGMSKVGAVSGASAEDMEKLEAKAREMGSTTVFSAKEASDAFYYMSLAGWDAEESMDGISGVMDLAAASGEDLASVSDIVTDGLTAFGLEAKESGRMANVLASASANANTDVAGLGKAFQYTAPVAGALGYTIEDTSKAIGLMANAGIKGEKAGTALRTMMTNLAKPTSEAKKAMEKYGISIKDSEGNMKSFDDIMLDLRKTFKGLDKEQQAQIASTIFGKEAMSGALAIVNASEEDYGKLSDAINESEDAASDMADVMQNNLQGSVKELKSMVEDLFIEMYQNLKPTLEVTVEKLKDLTQWFGNLSPKTQENIVKFGLLAAAAGPVLSMFGKMSIGAGALIQTTGSLAKTIGLSNKTGLVGAFARLGPAGIAIGAVAGVAAIGTAIYKATKKSEKAEEVNLDLAKSFSDQSIELENSANTFDKLSSKAKISNEQLAELNDLNIRISQSSNPGEIAELQKQYDYLAKKSGLSKDELRKLFEANSNIIEQSPNVEKSVSDQGNAFAKNTDEVRKYIQSLEEATLIELEGERTKALENEKRLRKEINNDQKELNLYLEQMGIYTDAIKMSEGEIANRIEEINGLYRDGNISTEEKIGLQQEQTALMDIQSGKYSEAISRIQEQIEKKRESIGESETELEKIDVLNQEMGNLVLKQAGITEEGKKGLENLDQSILKNQEEMAKLDEKLEKNGKLTESEQERYDKLVETNNKQLEAKQYLAEELGIYRDLNSLAELKLSKLDAEKQKKVESLAKTADIKVEEGNIVGQLQKKNSEHDNSISKLEKEREKNGSNKKKIDEQISSLETKKSKNSEVIKKVLEELGIWKDLDGKIKDGINSEIRKGKATDDTKGKLKNQGDQIDSNNKKTDQGTKKEKERTKEAGKDVDKKVTAKDHGSVAKIDKKATTSKNKKVTAKDHGSVAKIDKKATKSKDKKVNAKDYGTIKDLDAKASSPVTKVVNFIGKGLGKLKFWAKGTPPSGHPGGAAVVGDGGGRELITLPSGKSFLSPDTDTLMNLPRGTHVVPHRQTKRIMKSIPKYADGTNNWSSLFTYDRLKDNEFMKLLALDNKSTKSEINISARNNNKRNNNQTNDDAKEMMMLLVEQNEHLQKSNELLTKLVGKDLDLYKLNRKVDEGISDIGYRKKAAWGG